MADVGFMSAVKLTQSLRDGDISSRELFEHYLSRIETHNPALNAVVTLDSERARAEANAADAALSRGGAWPSSWVAHDRQGSLRHVGNAHDRW